MVLERHRANPVHPEILSSCQEGWSKLPGTTETRLTLTSCPAAAGASRVQRRSLNVEISHEPRVRLDEQPTRLDVIAHEHLEDPVRLHRVLHVHLEQRAPLGIHGSVPELL